MKEAHRERWLKVRSVFEQVFDLPEDERAARVEDLCAGDDALREEVAAMLAWDAEAESFLGAPPTPGPPRPAHPAHPANPTDGPREPERLGPYRLERRLGRGGMGSVWLATRDDGVYRQEVAVKILHRGLDSATAVSRFRAERQILALLEHPNIARLLDGGTTPDGRPYLVIERVEGEPVDRWCDRRDLPVEDRLRLFLEVCRAVSYAHRRLVVHRDLKPANILIDAEGRPRLLDFGIAKLLDDEPRAATMLDTQPGLVPMTPEYASPEQAAGEVISAQSDVYSLGVVLFELLTGRRPYRLETDRLDEVVRAVCEQPAPSPSTVVTRPPTPRRTDDDTRPADPETLAANRGADPRRLARTLAGDLDNIVLTALRKDPERRYPSVERLARDIELYLEGHPVSARPDTFRYRAGKFVRRHRLAVSAATVAVSLLVALLIGLLVQQGRLVRERNRAEAVSGFLVDVFAQPDPERSRGETVTARELLDRGAARIGDRFRDQPAARADLLLTLGRSYRNLGLLDTAEPLLLESLALHRRSAGPGGSADVARSLHEAAELAALQGRFETAVEREREAVEWLETRPEADPADLAASLVRLARAHEQLGDYERAEERFGEAIATARRGDDPEVLAEALDRFGILRSRQGRAEEAEALFREALELLFTHRGPRHPDVALVRNDLGLLLLNGGDYEEAEELLLHARRDHESLFEGPHTHLGITLNNLGLLRLRQGRLDEAETLLAEALEMQRGLYEEPNPRIATTLQNQGELWLTRGRTEAAEDAYRQTLEQRRAVLPPRHPDLAVTLNHLGLLLAGRNHLEEAQAAFEEALLIGRDRLGENHALVGMIRAGLAQVHHSRGDRERAERSYRDALRILEKSLGSDHPELAATWFNLASLQQEGGDLEAAEESYRRALDLTRKNHGADHLHTAMASLGLADLLLKRGDWAGAETLAAGALPVFERNLEPGNVWLAVVRRMLAESWLELGREEEARPLLAALVDARGAESERAEMLLERLETGGDP